jgi:glucosamine-phosphate N-acetyltransferase
MEATQRPSRLEVTIRDLIETDLGNGFLDALAALSEVKLTPEQARRVYDELAPNLRTFVAVSQGRVVGTTRLLVERKFIHGGGLVGHIEDVAVAEAYQHRGVGTSLVAHAVAEAKRLGCYKVILDCFDDLAPFYERIGFRPFNRGFRLNLAPPH